MPAEEAAMTNQQVETTPNSAKTKPNKFVHTTAQQFRAMVMWLENPRNYKIIVGESTAGKSVAHGVGITKIEGFKRMTSYVHGATMAHMSSTGVFDAALADPWSAQVCQSRWKSYFARYKSTRDKLKHQTGFGITADMLAHGITLEAMVNKSCPYYYRLDKIFCEQSNVEPSSHTVEPEMEEGDACWGLDSSVDISCNEEVFRSPDGEAPVQQDPEHEAGDLLLNFELPVDVSAAELMPPIESVMTTTSEASAGTAPTSASLPSLPSLATRDRIAAVQNGDAQGVDKANNAKRRDFGSITRRLPTSVCNSVKNACD
ncbi:hypothetical protein PF005_g12747 [Phytophthora fragariae]|uniref:Uncharacterized protein n=1 Tax=Phytophthora fragariae TaxID=53985 RepID=A0A6A3F1J7_9STRA|nr:hypothetical protein PF003_g23530 [Phytophthora fragariae]KAE8936108.1 hypothetical protein PF009_g13966 [Phytophthora fragariae]KAE9006139.1 hypothetical protein PF011_g11726 [Phytophthora fragariae]KAE9107345.1 hypothetical protein PF007_g13082 [Phytophthora fragariae]KAE9143085.1 hypothetical protein PF006_g11874 [Phytophthora fragariae]